MKFKMYTEYDPATPIGEGVVMGSGLIAGWWIGFTDPIGIYYEWVLDKPTQRQQRKMLKRFKKEVQKC